MGNIIGQPLEGYVANQINSRQVLHGSGVRLDQNERTPDQINILNSNTAWIKLASGVFIDPSGSGEQKLKDLGFTETERSNLSGMGLAKKYVLYAGTSQYNNGTLSQREGFRPPTFESVYKDDELKGAIARDSEDSSYIYSRNLNSQGLHESDSGYAPMPGIISAEIKSLNRGSLEKAFIKIKAQNRQQLDIIDTLYMRLGYTVLLEWGNSLYTDDGINKKVVRNTIIEDKFFQHSGKRSYLDFLGLPKGKNVIENYRNKYSGNYDGMLAVISNFSWTFNPDGSYDIDLTLISLGDVIESLKTNLSVNSTYRTFIKNNSNSNNGSVIEKGKDLNSINTMLWLWTINNPSNNSITIKFGDGTTRKVGSFLNPGPNSLVDIEAKYDFYEILDGEEYLISGSVSFKSKDPDDDADNSLKQKFNSRYAGEDFRGQPSISGNSKKRVIKGTLRHSGIWVATETLLGITPEAERALELALQINIPNIATAKTELTVQRILFYKRTSYVPDRNSAISNPLKTAPYHSAFVLNTTTPNYYLRFDYLLQYLQENIIPEIESDGENASLFNLDYDRWHNYMYSLPNQFSLDPKICLVRNDNFDKGPKGIPSVLHELSYFRVADKGVNENKNFAYPLSIYLNFQFIKSSLSSNLNDKGDVNIYGFISTICTGLNRALGGINNLEPVIDKDNNTLKIIDSTPIPGVSSPTNTNYLLRLYGYRGADYQEDYQSYTNYVSNFVRNIDLKTSITPEYATMVTVGATANGYVKGTEATAFSVFNKGLTDRFKNKLVTPEELSTVPENEAETNYFSEFLDKVNQCYGIDGNLKDTGILGDFNQDIIGKNISTVTEFYKYIIAKKGKNTTQAGTLGFIPFKLGITLDGISGIKIYNKLNIDSSFLPVRYGDTLNFIITGVNHKLQNNDWETTLDTIVMPKTSEIKTFDIDFSAIATTSSPPSGSGGGSCGNLASGKWASLPYKSYQKTTLTDLAVVNYLFQATSDIAVRRATFAIYAVESRHGAKGVNNNYIGLQTDGGGFLGTRDLNYVTGTTTLRDNSGTCRSFATYDTWQKCIDHLIQIMIDRKQSGSSSRKMVPTNPNDADYFGKGYANNWVGSGSTAAFKLGKSLYISAQKAYL